MTHTKSVALMKFLSDVASRHGVGKHVYVVGGAVRNFVIGQPIKDIDVVIDSVALNGKDSAWFAEEVSKAIPAPGRASIVTNNYGVAILTVKGDWLLDGDTMDGEVIEIANARKESYGGAGGKGYKPHTTAPATIEEDVVRREFTFNSLLWRMIDLADGPDKAEIIDLTGCGLKDLAEGAMRCPRDPDIVFNDDPSRMIRAIRFLLKYGFKVPPDVEASIRRNAEKLKNMPGSHLSNMLIETFFEPGIGKKAILEMQKLGLLDVLKEIAQSDKQFREALANWADRKAEIEFVFDLMDFGLPSGKRLGFLTPAQQQRVREVTVEMTADVATHYVAVLNQPGKVIDMAGIIKDSGLSGREVRQVQKAAQTVLLDDPSMLALPVQWEARVREVVSTGRPVPKVAAEEFERDVAGMTKEMAGLAPKWGYEVVELGRIGDDPVVLLRPKDIPQDVPRVLVIGGTHGNEPSSPFAIQRFFREDPRVTCPGVALSFIPCVNPAGFKHNKRRGITDEDPNREMLDGQEASPEGELLQEHTDLIQQLGRDGALSLHEDWEERHFYVYSQTEAEDRKTDPVAYRLATTGQQFFPLHADGEKAGGFLTLDGIVWGPEDSSIETWLCKVDVPVYTVETPGTYDLDLRIQCQQAIIIEFGKAAFDCYWEHQLERKVVSRYLKRAAYFGVGDLVLFGKYKNKKGILREFSVDPHGNPVAVIEPVPKGRKSDKVIGLFKFWQADPQKRLPPTGKVSSVETLSPKDQVEYARLLADDPETAAWFLELKTPRRPADPARDAQYKRLVTMLKDVNVRALRDGKKWVNGIPQHLPLRAKYLSESLTKAFPGVAFARPLDVLLNDTHDRFKTVWDEADYLFKYLNQKGASAARVADRWARLNLPPDRWVVTRPSALDPDQKDRVWDLYHTSYGSIGQQVTNVAALMSDFELMWAKDIDGDGSIDAFIAYKRTPAGNKPIIIGTDGTSAAKRQMLTHQMGLLKRRGWYAELSGRPAEIAEAHGVPKVMDEIVVRTALRKDIQWLGDGKYLRSITGLGTHEKSMYGNPKVTIGKAASEDPIEVIDFVRGYKQITGVRRIPIARNTDPKTRVETLVIGNDEIDRAKLRISGKEYLTDEEMVRLFKGEVVIEEKVDGHPVVVVYGGYTFFCESLRIQHTVGYDAVPYSMEGWPDMTVVYEVMDGEARPPYHRGQGTGKWLSRSEKEAVCSLVGAPLVPLVYKGHLTPETLPKLADRLSVFGGSKIEGVVVKNLKTGVFGKFINLEFQKAISDESLYEGVHPEQRGIRNLRKYAKQTITEDTDIDGWETFRKILPTKAVKMDEAFEVETLEGTMQAKAGDWLAEGPEGERYAIDADIFKKTYEKMSARRVASRWAAEKRAKLRVFDFDDTLVSSSASVSIKTSEGETETVDSATFAHYRVQHGDEVDFGAFNDVVKPRIIKKNFDTFKEAAKQSDTRVVILTARPKGSASAVSKFLESHGVKNVEVVALASSDPYDKARWIDKAIETEGHNDVEFTDDSKSNAKAVAEHGEKHKVIKFKSINTPHPKEADYDGPVITKTFSSDNPTVAKVKFDLKSKEPEPKEKPKAKPSKSEWWENQTDAFHQTYCGDHPASRYCKTAGHVNAAVKREIAARKTKMHPNAAVSAAVEEILVKIDLAGPAAGAWLESLESHYDKVAKAEGAFKALKKEDFATLREILFGASGSGGGQGKSASQQGFEVVAAGDRTPEGWVRRGWRPSAYGPEYGNPETAAERVAAKYKNKKTVKTKDGEDMVVYEYSDRQISNRNKGKAERIEKLRHSIDDLRKQVRKDLEMGLR